MEIGRLNDEGWVLWNLDVFKDKKNKRMWEKES